MDNSIPTLQHHHLESLKDQVDQSSSSQLIATLLELQDNAKHGSAEENLIIREMVKRRDQTYATYRDDQEF